MSNTEISYYDLSDCTGRIFFTTDIHGHFDLLHEQMQLYAFDTKKDILFVGGDNCDRGPNSDWVLDYLSEPWYISIRANHEQLVIETYKDCLAGTKECNSWASRCLYENGGEWWFDQPTKNQQDIYESFKSLPLAIDLTTKYGTVGIVHAEVPYNNWNEFKKMTNSELTYSGQATCQWARTKYDKRQNSIVEGIDVVLCGHSPTNSGNVEVLGNQVYADLGSFFRNKICFIEINEEFFNEYKR